jgi:GAF domain-containing protein
MVETNRDELTVLVEQQAALRRVATLVARGVPPSDVFAAVVMELSRCLGTDYAALFRCETGGAATLVAAWDRPGATKEPVGGRFSLEVENLAATVLRTGRAARMDSHGNAPGSAAADIPEPGSRSGVGAPIVVDGRLWGSAIVGSSGPEALPPDTAARVGDFADLVATAIANAATREELTASRARIVAAADDARRRFERDLHDGAQQGLVSLGLELRTLEAAVPPELPGSKGRSQTWLAVWLASRRICRRSHGGSTRRSCLREDSAQRSIRSPAAPASRSSSTSA